MKKINKFSFTIVVFLLAISTFSDNLNSMRSKAQDIYQIMRKEDLEFNKKYQFKLESEKIKQSFYITIRDKLVDLIEENRCEDLSIKYKKFLDKIKDNEYIDLRDFALDNIKTRDKERLLEFAIANSYNKCINTLINLGSDPNLVNSDGDSYLMIAIKSDNLKSVKLLLSKRPEKKKINVNYVNKNNGKNALMLAQENGLENIVELIRKYYKNS